MQTKKRAKPVKFGKAIDDKKASEDKETKVAKAAEEEKLEPVKKNKDLDVADAETIDAKEEVKEAQKSTKKETEEEKTETKHDEEFQEEVDSEAEEEGEPQEESGSESRDEGEEEKSESEQPSPFGSFTKEEERRSGSKGSFSFFFLVAFLTFLVGLVLISAVSYLMPDQKESLKVISTQETPTPGPGEEVTPTPSQVDYSAYTVAVLNGSGTTGEAAKVKAQLEDAGFKVGTVGNADTSDYTKTVITAKKTVDQKYLDALTTELKKNYSVNSVVESAPTAQTSDVVVTVGSSAAQ